MYTTTGFKHGSNSAPASAHSTFGQHVFRRPLSRNWSRVEPWATRWQHQNISDEDPNLANPLGVASGPHLRASPYDGSVFAPCKAAPQVNYGSCECLAGKVVGGCAGGSTNAKPDGGCASGYQPVCDAVTGSRCICSNLSGDNGCGTTQMWCPG